jgi:hypothetical protein
LPKALLAFLGLSLVSVPTLHSQEFPVIGIDGQVRLRGEWDGRSAGVDPDAATLSRIRVGVRAQLESWIRAYIQLQDARAWGTEANTLTDASADQFDLHQGFVEIGMPNRVVARMGRQEMILGDERLVGAVGWTNTARSFDGARVMGRAGRFEWTAFWMTVAERDALLATGLDPQANQGDNDDGWLLGGFVSRSIPGGAIELTALADRDAATDESYTVNLRAHGAAGLIRYEAAGAVQFGPDRKAYFASGKLEMAGGRGTVALQLDYLSGDDDPSDAERKAFNTLYATNHKFYGYMDYILAFPGQTAEAGLVDAMVRASLRMSPRWTVNADVHRFGTAAERAGQHALGTELDAIADWSMARLASLQLGVGVFLPQDLAVTLLPAFAGGSDPTYWGYVQLSLRWP